MKRFGSRSKNDFIVEVIIAEWLTDHKADLEKFNKQFKEEKSK